MQTNQKKVKVSWNGETKRLTVTNDYAALVKQTQQAFGPGLINPIKYFYLDDENEIISINSQSDFNEALMIEDFQQLKLTVASNVAEARKQLQSAISEHMSLAESLSQSQFLAHPIHGSGLRETASEFNDFEKEFEQIDHAKPFATFRESTQASTKHDMACGSDIGAPLRASVSAGTGVEGLVMRNESSCMTNMVSMCDQQQNTNVPTSTTATQMKVETNEIATGHNPIQMADQCSQMIIDEVDCSNAEVSCNLIVPDSDDEKPRQEITCFKCNGSQENKSGLPCRKCKGTGAISAKGYSEVVDLVKAEVKELCTNNFTGLMKDYLVKKRDEQAKEVHSRIICDECDMTPVTGVRFMCSVCDNYDLCQNCEAAGKHKDHPMLKIRKESQAPAKLICQYNEVQEEQKLAAAAAAKAKQAAQNEVLKATAERRKPGKRINYSGRFVKESIGDKHLVAPGQQITKLWTFRNDGEHAWPLDTLFIQTNGDEMGAAPREMNNVINPGDEHVWQLDLVAPQKPGRYTAYFRMCTGENKRFGHKVWCDIQVFEPIKEEIPIVPELAISQIVEQAPVKLIKQADPVVFHDEQMIEDKVMDKKLSLSSLIKTPKQVYFEKIEGENGGEDLVEALISLYEFGFVDYEVNRKLFLKDRDVNKVAEALMSGNLSESQFSAVFDKKEE